MSKHTQPGYTLVEMTVVLSIAGLVMAWVLGSVNRVIPSWNVERAAQDIAASMRAARSKAMVEGVDATIPFDVAGRRYQVITRSAPGASYFETDFGGNLYAVNQLPDTVVFKQPSGNNNSVTCSPPASGGDKAVSFNAAGVLLSSSTPCYVYVANRSEGVYRRVRVTIVGTVAIQKWTGSRWES